MKRKILLLLLIPAVLILVTGCNKKNETDKKQKDNNKATIDLFDEKMGIKSTFTYNKNDNFTDFKKEEGGASKSMTFRNENLDVKFEMYYNIMTKTTYETSQSIRTAQKYYKEYKFGKYEAYAYGEYDDGLYLNILVNDDNDTLNVLFVSIDRIDNNKEVIVSKVVDEEIIQDFFKSMKVKMSK